jgi:hypothetical protein
MVGICSDVPELELLAVVHPLSVSRTFGGDGTAPVGGGVIELAVETRVEEGRALGTGLFESRLLPARPLLAALLTTFHDSPVQ